MFRKRKARKPRSESGPIAGAVILLAMAITAAAFGAGLYVHAGASLIVSLIAGAALFVAMAASQSVFARSQQQGDVEKRLATLESSLGDPAQHVVHAGSVVSNEHLEQLSRRVDSLRQYVEQAEQLGSAAEAAAQINRLAGETERLDARLEALRTQVKIEAQERHDEIRAELQMVETLVKQVAERLAAGAELQNIVEGSVGVSEATQNLAEQGESFEGSGDLPLDSLAPFQPEYSAPEPSAEEDDIPPLDPDEVESLMMEEIRRSVEANKIELYLQPIMILPRRRIRYYEALTRLKNEAGRVILPKDYLNLAESGGMMPVIDNVMLFRSVQVLRRLESRSSARGVFCNISIHSLLDPEFFGEFIGFMEQNTELAGSMFFEFSQAAIKNCGPMELEGLNALAVLGFRFSLDQVIDLNVDFQKYHGMGFRTIKIAADVFLDGMEEAGARIHSADMASYLERFGMQLIVEKIEDETTLMRVQDHNVKLGQGYLFSEPRPVRPEVFEGSNGAEAAA